MVGVWEDPESWQSRPNLHQLNQGSTCQHQLFLADVVKDLISDVLGTGGSIVGLKSVIKLLSIIIGGNLPCQWHDSTNQNNSLFCLVEEVWSVHCWSHMSRKQSLLFRLDSHLSGSGQTFHLDPDTFSPMSSLSHPPSSHNTWALGLWLLLMMKL